MNIQFVFVFEYVKNVISCTFVYRSLYLLKSQVIDTCVDFDKFYMVFYQNLERIMCYTMFQIWTNLNHVCFKFTGNTILFWFFLYILRKNPSGGSNATRASRRVLIHVLRCGGTYKEAIRGSGVRSSPLTDGNEIEVIPLRFWGSWIFLNARSVINSWNFYTV